MSSRDSSSTVQMTRQQYVRNSVDSIDTKIAQFVSGDTSVLQRRTIDREFLKISENVMKKIWDNKLDDVWDKV